MGDPQPLLRGSYGDVGEGGLGVEGYQDVAVGLNRCVCRGIGRFDLAPDATEDVDLPDRAEPESEEVGCAKASGGCEVADDSILARLCARRITGKIDLRHLGAGDDAPQGARLFDPPHRLAQGKVAAGRTHDEAVEQLIVKDLPPGLENGIAVLETLGRRRVPGVGHLSFRLLIIRSHRRAPDQQRHSQHRYQSKNLGAIHIPLPRRKASFLEDAL